VEIAIDRETSRIVISTVLGPASVRDRTRLTARDSPTREAEQVINDQDTYAIATTTLDATE